MSVPPNFEGQDVTPLVEVEHYAKKLRDIPSAGQLYRTILQNPQFPLDPSFSNLVGRLAPYLSFRQIEFLLDARSPSDWQQADLRRLRYVFSIKRKVLEIAESYGGFSFLPQSFLVSVFLGEATKQSLRVSQTRKTTTSDSVSGATSRKDRSFRLRKRRVRGSRDRRGEIIHEDFTLGPAHRAAPLLRSQDLRDEIVLEYEAPAAVVSRPTESYVLGDSLLGPRDVAILLQSGLTSVMKSSTVVQLNQRMLLDLICSQPKSFAVAVLAEIGTPSGEASPWSLTSALLSLLELDQTAFTDSSKIDMHTLLESLLPGLKVPRRDDYMAGGRWARQSYYEAIHAVAKNVLDDAETYLALNCHLQSVRHHKETAPIPGPLGEPSMGPNFSTDDHPLRYSSTLKDAKTGIAKADEYGRAIMQSLIRDPNEMKATNEYRQALDAYRKSFASCAELLELDKYAFQLPWFREYYQRNFDALMIKSVFDNVIDNVDNVRLWMQALRNGSQGEGAPVTEEIDQKNDLVDTIDVATLDDPFDSDSVDSDEWKPLDTSTIAGDGLFMSPEFRNEQVIVDAIIDALIYSESDRVRLRNDPLVRLLIPNPPGVHYNFAIVSAMGVITEGERGLELKDAFERLERHRGVVTVRAATGTARSLQYNANKIEQAVEHVVAMGKPYGLLGYSQGCPNSLMAETIMNSGSPAQRKLLQGLVSRQLLFSAANGSVHAPATEKKAERLMTMCEEFFKYQQGYASRALASTVLAVVTDFLGSADFHKFMGGARGFLPDGCRAFWREAQHLTHVPTCTVRGVLEPHTTPECLEMITNLLTKQSGSKLHDSQVHVYDAVGHPVYHRNRNSRIMERCDVGGASIQRTHHWSPLSDEVAFLKTEKDTKQGMFECAKDRHVFPWVEVNARFGFIKPMSS